MCPHAINRTFEQLWNMAKRIIALLGSPLLGGNTARLLNEAIRGAEEAGCEVEKIAVTHLDFKPCMEIFYCMEHEGCRIRDDMTEMYEKFREMDSLIVATPVMTMGIPGKLKSFMDRFQVFYMAKYYRGESFIPPERRKERRMLFISISGMAIPNVFDGAKLTARAFGEIIDCPYWDEVLQNDMDTIKDIRTKPDVMEAAYKKGYELGRRLTGGG
jgi:multimeric flavodoxin WrbA